MAVDAPVAEEESESTKLAKGLIKPEPSKYTRGSEEHFTATAAQFLNIYVGLMPQPETDAAFVKMIQESCLGPSNVKGVPAKNAVLIYCDSQLIGESLKRPSTRLPPIEDNLLHTLIGNALKARGSTPIGKGNTQVDCPIEGDIVIVNDGGRGNDLCLAPFRSAKTRGTRGVNGYLEIFDLNVVISQDSIKSKKKRNRGSVNQIQRLSFITRECLDRMVPERKHDKFTGSNRGNVLAFVGLASSAQTWHTTVEDKKEIFKNKIFGTSGGGEPDDDNNEEPEAAEQEELARKDTDVEPCFYHFLPKNLFDTILSSWSISAVLDLTPGQGELAKSAIEKRLAYYGVCLSERHSAMKKRKADEGDDGSDGEKIDEAKPKKPKTKKTKKEGDENATPTVKKVKQVELCSDEDSESREK
ncbi:unnamed protein product [Durusdinium trenchii]|uniref:Uncharacterized protein n=1 Tax=Durusdinium trenchii TaxID=1381693 RepID=A0ABP0PAS2_9DINO